MSVKPLNHYSMTNPASVYDEEALTALELAGRTAAKVNEAVEAFNELETETKDRLTAQEEKQIPKTVASEVKAHIDNGDFDNAINEYVGNLETRVNNLTKGITPGSTTADAELIDIRTGRKAGETYPNAGEAVRAKANRSDINRFFDNDIFAGQGVNLYPFDDDEFTQPDFPSNQKAVANSEIELAPGSYVLVITHTNAPRIIVTYRRESDVVGTVNRIADIVNPTTSAYYFTVPGTTEKCYVSIHYGTTVSTPGHYFFKRAYIFEKHAVKIPSEFVHAGTSIVDSAEVIAQKGENLYTGGESARFDYDGTSLNKNITYEQNIKPGKYMIRIQNVLPRVIITTLTDERILDKTGMSPNEYYKFTVPEGATGIRIIGYMSTSSTPLLPAGKYTFTGITILEDNGKPFLPDYLTRYDELVNLIKMNAGGSNGDVNIAGKYLTAKASNVSYIEIPDEVHVKQNYSISFTGKLNGSSYFRIGHGKTAYQSNYLEVNGGHMEVFSYTTADPVSVFTGDITTTGDGHLMNNFISVDIHVVKDVATITVVFENGHCTKKEVPWTACNGKVFAEAVNGVFETAEIRWISSDLEKKVWIFGDSYMSADNIKRVNGCLQNRGYSNYLCSGYPGGNSNAELISLRNLLKLNKPDVIIWCLGMNDGDTGNTVNNSWLTSFNIVKSLCAERDIELIAATIPNTPVVSNSAKNNIVRSSGLRYIDFAAAVNTTGNEWYAGLLDTDNVHPTARGAWALASRMIIDAPEVMR